MHPHPSPSPRRSRARSAVVALGVAATGCGAPSASEVGSITAEFAALQLQQVEQMEKLEHDKLVATQITVGKGTWKSLARSEDPAAPPFSFSVVDEPLCWLETKVGDGWTRYSEVPCERADEAKAQQDEATKKALAQEKEPHKEDPDQFARAAATVAATMRQQANPNFDPTACVADLQPQLLERMAVAKEPDPLCTDAPPDPSELVKEMYFPGDDAEKARLQASVTEALRAQPNLLAMARAKRSMNCGGDAWLQANGADLRASTAKILAYNVCYGFPEPTGRAK